ncbi:DUF3047 domain-containing protein [Oxalobacteraceae bacterium OM1]|nr:DUF3047 domain-containing protein [Oxalobacteraceae bacterium OM1]
MKVLPLIVFLAALAGCASHPATAPVPAPQAAAIPAFSRNPPGGLPTGWKPLVILRTKKPTDYKLIDENGRTVLHARAEGASSALMHDLVVDPAMQPELEWQWKISGLVHSADNTHRATEDSPVRIVLGFDGDKDNLPFKEQVLFETAKLVTGHDFPYATLMYIWENRLPVGTVIDSHHSSRIKMIVAASGPQQVGEWCKYRRNIVADFEKAFGEKPGKLLGVGVLTDTDNTGETGEAWYGDIRFVPRAE